MTGPFNYLKQKSYLNFYIQVAFMITVNCNYMLR